MATKDGRHTQEVATNANHGKLKNPTGTATPLRTSQMQDWMETTAETQMARRAFGATPWMRTSDGSTATQLYGLLDGVDAMRAGLSVQTE
jgi:hypothetical protein